jgi:hypothetical protein
MQIMDCVQLELYSNNFEGYKVEKKLHLGVREQKLLITTDLQHCGNYRIFSNLIRT